MKKENLFLGLKKGDRTSIQNIYSENLSRVTKWIMKNGGAVEDGHDIFQDSLEVLYLMENMDGNYFEATLFKICKYKWIDKLRRKTTDDKVRKELAKRIDNEIGIDKQYIQYEKEHLKFRLLEQTFEKLSDKCKKLMTMTKEGFKVEEIVEALSFASANTMYRRKSACIERWSHLLRADSMYNEILL